MDRANFQQQNIIFCMITTIGYAFLPWWTKGCAHSKSNVFYFIIVFHYVIGRCLWYCCGGWTNSLITHFGKCVWYGSRGWTCSQITSFSKVTDSSYSLLHLPVTSNNLQAILFFNCDEEFYEMKFNFPWSITVICFSNVINTRINLWKKNNFVGNPHRVTAKLQECCLKVSWFDLQSYYYIRF